MPNKFVRTLEGAVLVGALLTIPLTLLGENNPTERWVQIADWTVWAIFLLEYVAMVLVGPTRTAYVKRNPLNLAVIIFSYPGLPQIFGSDSARPLGTISAAVTPDDGNRTSD